MIRRIRAHRDVRQLCFQRRTRYDILHNSSSNIDNGDGMAEANDSRDQLATAYLEQLPYEPYPVQEEALLAWFTSEQGVLVCAPTGTGKTLIAEAAVFEALRTGTTMYYTTPLIALTEQKFRDLQQRAEAWGFRATDVGLVTGNRRENPQAPILVVVAEILLNRLLHTEAFDFRNVTSVVMDEFHNFADRERGIVWELTLGLLPAHVRTLLLSATVGNSREFAMWLRRAHQRQLDLVESQDRKVPLTFQWIPDMLLNEQIEAMATGDDTQRTVPSLIFCFNRDTCWNIAEQLKGKQLLMDGQQKRLVEQLEQFDWSQGAGPKLRQILLRGVGVHHAGILPKYRRIVEDLFQQKLLSVAVCTETLSAGINLPARSVVLPTLLKGPPGAKKTVDASTAHQIFGRAGRPQYDSQGYVFALAHEDDVKIDRWRRQYDQIPEDTKDPNLRKAKKALKKKMPKRRTTEQYWEESHFNRLRTASPARLRSTGPLPWRLLAYMLDASPDVSRLRDLVGKRLMVDSLLHAEQKRLDQMLQTLAIAGYVTLEPARPSAADETDPEAPPYQATHAHPTDKLPRLMLFRGVNPLFGNFLLEHLGIADQAERLQAWEAILEMPGAVAHSMRVPDQTELPPGPLAMHRLDGQLLQLGLAAPEELVPAQEDPDDPDAQQDRRSGERVWILTVAEKLRRLFDYEYPGVTDLKTVPVWSAGQLLEFGGDFNKMITSKGLQKQEGILFRHLLRLILLVNEFRQLTPPDIDEPTWQQDLQDVTQRLADSCRRIDPASTEKTIEETQARVELI